MAPRKGAQENSKKAAGQARKAEAAAAKKAAEQRKKDAEEDVKWQAGAKSNLKSEEKAARAAEAVRKKAEREALLKAEEASLPSKPRGTGPKTQKKNARNTSLDNALASLSAPSSNKKAASLHASGIDNALDALSLTQSASDKIDRHPERRFKAAYTVFETRRLEEMKDEKGLRRQQKVDIIRKEFERHPDNPFNQASARYNASRAEIEEIHRSEQEKIESRLTQGGSAS